MSTEVIDTTSQDRSPRRNLLDHVDDIARMSPLSHLIVGEEVRMEVMVGRREPRQEGEEPMQVIVARVPEQGIFSRRITIARRVLTTEMPTLVHVNDDVATDLVDHRTLSDDGLTDIGRLLDETDFTVGDGSPTLEFQSRMMQPGRYQGWLDGLVDSQPLVDLV
jgi:hypothetical protein